MNSDIKDYLNSKKSPKFNELLFSLIDKCEKTDSEIYKKADLDRRLFSKIRCNDSYIPRKNNIIKLCLSLGLDKETTNSLLSSAGYTLSSTKEFDLIISYCLENNIYDFDTINNYLYTYGNAVL